jgi:hypothetical protein
MHDERCVDREERSGVFPGDLVKWGVCPFRKEAILESSSTAPKIHLFLKILKPLAKSVPSCGTPKEQNCATNVKLIFTSDTEKYVNIVALVKWL